MKHRPGTAERLWDRGCPVGQDWKVSGHGFDQRHAEALMFAQRHVGRRCSVVDRQLVVGHSPDEQEAFRGHLILKHQRPDGRVVRRYGVRSADENESVVGVDVALVVLGQPNVVFDSLVRRDPSDKQDIREAVVENGLESRTGIALLNAFDIDDDRTDGGVLEAEPLQFLPVVL